MDDPNEAALIAAMDAYGQDDLPGRWAGQLVLADWYEERNDKRAIGWRWLAENLKTPKESVSSFMMFGMNAGPSWDWWKGLGPIDDWPKSHPGRPAENRYASSHYAEVPAELFDAMGRIARPASIAFKQHYIGVRWIESDSMLSAELLLVATMGELSCIALTPQSAP